MRGKIELRSGGNLLTADEALEALTNSRNFANTILTLQEQFDAAAVAKLKRFHQEFFNEPNPAADAKDAAQAFQKRLLSEITELEVLVSHADAYPFLVVLTPVVAELKTLANREWSHCLKNVAEFSEHLLDAKEAAIDPLKQFYNGPKRSIYDDIKGFLRDEAANFADVAGNDGTELREVIAASAPYKSNVLQQAKVKLEALRGKVSQVVATARAEGCARIDQARLQVKGMAEFGDLTAQEQKDVIQPFDSAEADLQHERLAPVIRQIADRMANDVLPRQLQRVAELAEAKKSGKATGGGTKAAQYVAARSIAVVPPKAVIETEQELDEYLAAVKKAFAAELRKGRRITL
jgi:hypothetical protein